MANLAGDLLGTRGFGSCSCRPRPPFLLPGGGLFDGGARNDLLCRWGGAPGRGAGALAHGLDLRSGCDTLGLSHGGVF
jgi:hypothetical protein